MTGDRIVQPLAILPFAWSHWRALWKLRFHQLAEYGIVISAEEVPDQPLNVGRDDHEWDYHHLAAVYLSGAGGFWLAWYKDIPVGHIGAQDFGGAIELRRMYVRAEYRRRGIGGSLVQTLIDHCRVHSIKAVELWTGENDLGRRLYERKGFKISGEVGKEYSNFLYQTNFVPGKDEIRMRLDLR